MGDSFFPQAAQRPEAEHAVDELIRRVNESPGELTILAQAPLTNIAAAVVRDPSIAQKVKRLYVMGGGIGNITPAAEFNFYVDPEAAKIVFKAGFPLTLFTWTLTLSHGVFFDDDLARIDALDTPLARFYRQVTRKARGVRAVDGRPRHDASRLDGRARRSSSRRSCSRRARRSSTSRRSGELTRGYLIDTSTSQSETPNCTRRRRTTTRRVPRALPRLLVSSCHRRGAARAVDTAQALTRFHLSERARSRSRAAAGSPARRGSRRRPRSRRRRGSSRLAARRVPRARLRAALPDRFLEEGERRIARHRDRLAPTSSPTCRSRSPSCSAATAFLAQTDDARRRPHEPDRPAGARRCLHETVTG